ncbi:MAG: TVP38/TMEM64 family protein [Bacilli bacterium]
MLLNSFLFNDYYVEVINFYTENLGVIGGFFLSFIENVFPPLPIFAIVIANVTSFGYILGFLISYFGHVLGAYCVFLFLRSIVKPKIFNKLKKESKLARFEKWVSNRSFIALLLVLSLPFFPYFFVNMSAAFSTISKKKYLIALIIGNLFMIGYLSFVGVIVENALESNNYYALVYPIILIVLAYISGKIIENKFNLK